jgi:hypothetical protein
MALTHNDGGYKSRKWVGLCICIVTIFLAGKFIAAAALAEVVFGIVSVYGVFCGANVGRDWAAMKNGATIAPPPTNIKDVVKDVVKAAKEAKDPKGEEEGS